MLFTLQFDPQRLCRVMRFPMRAHSCLIYCFCLLSVIGPAFADDQSGASFTIAGNAKAVCGIGAAQTTGTPDNMSLSQSGAGSATVMIGKLIEAGSARLKPGRISLKFQAVCNHPNYVSLTSLNGGLNPASGMPVVAGDFLNHVNYAASLSWGDIHSELQTSGAASEATAAAFTNGAARGNLTVNIDIASGPSNPDLPLLADTYADTLVLKLGAQY
jgi:hypothetical protein